MWYNFEDYYPLEKSKIAIAFDDGCGSMLGWVQFCDAHQITVLHAEDATPLYAADLDKSMWAYLPDDYPIHFMEQTVDDWY